jgi:hypothetical protein
MVALVMLIGLVATHISS